MNKTVFISYFLIELEMNILREKSIWTDKNYTSIYK